MADAKSAIKYSYLTSLCYIFINRVKIDNILVNPIVFKNHKPVHLCSVNF